MCIHSLLIMQKNLRNHKTIFIYSGLAKNNCTAKNNFRGNLKRFTLNICIRKILTINQLLLNTCNISSFWIKKPCIVVFHLLPTCLRHLIVFIDLLKLLIILPHASINVTENMHWCKIHKCEKCKLGKKSFLNTIDRIT